MFALQEVQHSSQRLPLMLGPGNERLTDRQLVGTCGLSGESTEETGLEEHHGAPCLGESRAELEDLAWARPQPGAFGQRVLGEVQGASQCAGAHRDQMVKGRAHRATGVDAMTAGASEQSVKVQHFDPGWRSDGDPERDRSDLVVSVFAHTLSSEYSFWSRIRA